MPLPLVAAMQWNECVSQASSGLKEIEQSNVFYLKYEDFVKNPRKSIDDIIRYFDLNVESNMSLPTIRTTSIGKGLNNLTEKELDIINPTISKTQKDHGYEVY